MSDLPVTSDSHEKAYGLLKVGLAYDSLRGHLISRNGSRETSGAQGTRSQEGKRGVQTRPIEPIPRLPEVLVVPEKVPPTASILALEAETSAQSLLQKSAQAFQEAITLAKRLNNPRTESYGLGYLGHLYEHENRWEDALTLTRRAIHAAQKVNAPESLYRWHWQTARVHRALENFDQAKDAYQRALYTLQPIRLELSSNYQHSRKPFRQGVGSLFFEFADLLLQRATRSTQKNQGEGLLREVRDIIESFKAAELQDYFQDQCVESARLQGKSLEKVSPGTAVVYPVILPDRLELLVSLPSGFTQKVVHVKEEQLTQKVRMFRESLEDRDSRDFLPQAQELYDWLIRPIVQDLKDSQVDTIVFVPDGPLRTIPLAPLHDGTQFLITQFALATTPGLTLTNPQPMDRENIRLLAVGLTEATQGFPPLPKVEDELKALQSIYTGKVLMNNEFRLSSFEKELQSQQYNVVHIASHGLVKQEAKDTFILAFDEKITMDRLAEMIGVFKFGAQPLELLTLSACQTAAGDDRAALGLAGIAIKAGAKSALATLWFIDDEATSKLIPDFYRELQEHPTISKATALQHAQMKFLNNPAYAHPSFWAPFLLINNWL